MDLASIVQWVFYILMAFLGLFGLVFGLELLYRLWHQVVLGEDRVDSDQGGLEFSRVANEILDRKGKPPVEGGTWLKRAEYTAVARELRRRYDEYAAIERIARGLSGDERARIILLQIEGCLAQLAGGSGDLGRLILEEGTFIIESERPVENGGLEVAFSARAWRESERLAPEDDEPIPVHGRIELDAALRTRHGPDGGAALTPHRTLVPPAAWTDGARRALNELRAANAVATSE